MADNREEWMDCPQCDGAGNCEAYVPELGYRAPVSCPRCNGRGRIRVDLVQNRTQDMPDQRTIAVGEAMDLIEQGAESINAAYKKLREV